MQQRFKQQPHLQQAGAAAACELQCAQVVGDMA
jgi:hypothetical protein